MRAEAERSESEPTKPVVCYVTDRNSLPRESSSPSLLEKIQTVVEAGADWVQLREKDLEGRELLDLTLAAVNAARGKALVFVNDRLDVAVAAGAAGAHLGRESLPVREAVRWFRGGNGPGGFQIGVSCHSVEEVREAEDAGAAYVFFGPVFDTPAKRKFGEPQGIERLAAAGAAVRIPVIAIGGVDRLNGADCVQAGARGIAAIRMFQETGDAALREAIAQLHGSSGRF